MQRRQIINGYQECSVCGKTKLVCEFTKDRSRIGGIRSDCQTCRSAYMREYRHKVNPAILSELRVEALANITDHQTCVKCEKVKPLSEFAPHPTSRTGINKKCRVCIREDAEKKDALTRRPNYNKNRHLQMQYGIGYDEYMRMFSLQCGVCAICGKPETRKIRGVVTKLCVDHDHSTGCIRALLCSRCNAAIGHLNDDVNTATALVEYLKKYKGNDNEMASYE